MFEFEATTYEILRYVDIKGDRPAKSVDQASFWRLEWSLSKA
jgi:hypothetical protein